MATERELSDRVPDDVRKRAGKAWGDKPDWYAGRLKAPRASDTKNRGESVNRARAAVKEERADRRDEHVAYVRARVARVVAAVRHRNPVSVFFRKHPLHPPRHH